MRVLKNAELLGDGKLQDEGNKEDEDADDHEAWCQLSCSITEVIRAAPAVGKSILNTRLQSVVKHTTLFNLFTQNIPLHSRN